MPRTRTEILKQITETKKRSDGFLWEIGQINGETARTGVINGSLNTVIAAYNEAEELIKLLKLELANSPE